MIKILLALLLLTPTSRAARVITCDGGGAHVVYDGATATYSANGAFVARSACTGTRMAVFNMTCTQDSAFDFYFASVPGPAVLGGKSARLDVAGKSTLMSCK